MATFLCPECSSLKADLPPIMSSSKSDEGKSHYILPIMITVIIGTLVLIVSKALYKSWQKRKRQRDQARFMRLFEDDDDMDDELGLREML